MFLTVPPIDNRAQEIKAKLEHVELGNTHNFSILNKRRLWLNDWKSCRINSYLSRVMRKPVFGICENKDEDQLRGNCEADQRLCFRYTDRTILLLPKSEILSF